MSTLSKCAVGRRIGARMALAVFFTWISVGAVVAQSDASATIAPSDQDATVAQSDPGAAVASSDPAGPVVEDPLDGLCTQIGRPLQANEIVDFLGNGTFASYVVRGVSSDYREVIGNFQKDRARSVRYLANGERTAQFVYAQGREICLTSPDGNKITCGVPLICSSRQADYVMVDQNDSPFARIDRPTKPDPEAPPAAKGYDWVTYAGGTVSLTIAPEPIARSGVTRSRNTSRQDNCRVGRGHPALDASYAYSWGTGQCGGQFAAGTGMVTYLSDAGQIGTIIMGPKTGIQTRNGQLSWSFPDKPIRVTVKCSNPQDTAIPTSAAQVSSIDVDLIVPDSVQTGDSVVYTKLVDALRSNVEEICGRGLIAKATSFRIRRTSKISNVDLALVWDGTNTTPIGTAPALKRTKARNYGVRTKATSRFAGFIRRTIDAQRTSTVLAALRSGGKLPNIADGMQESDVQTLVAMTRGMATWMPWEGRSPDFRNGEFNLSWNVTSSDPALDFFENRRQKPGWANVERVLPISSKPRGQLRLTCVISAREARTMASDRWVFVLATMTSFSSNSMVLRCKAP